MAPSLHALVDAPLTLMVDVMVASCLLATVLDPLVATAFGPGPLLPRFLSSMMRLGGCAKWQSGLVHLAP